MRTSFTTLIIIFLVGICAGCSKDDVDNITEEQIDFPQITGEWQWVGTTGGIIGEPETPESSGITRDIIITETEFIFYIDTEIIAERAYTYTFEESETTGLTEFIVTFEDNGFRDIVRRDDDFINFIDDCEDCYTSIYQLKN